MPETRQKLKKETVEQVTKLDQSIVYWSTQFTKATLSVRELESRVHDLYEFKKNTVIEDLKSQGVNIENSEVQIIDPETVLITSVEAPKSSNTSCTDKSCDLECKCT